MDKWGREMDAKSKVLVLGFLFCLSFQMLPGCLPDDMPSYTPDGKQIVLVANTPAAETKALWVCDLERRTTVPHFAPDRWQVESARWFGDQLWILCSRDEGVRKDKDTGKDVMDEKTGKPARDIKMMWSRFDIKTNRFMDGSPRITSESWVSPFVAGREGKPVLFVPTMPDKPPAHGKSQFNIYALPELKKPTTVKTNDTLPAGKVWSISFTETDPYKGVDKFEGLTTNLAEVDVFDDKGRKTCAIPAATIAPICHGGKARFPAYALVSNDASVMVMAFDTETIFRRHPRKYTFGVFETKTGKLLWSGASDSLRGTPLVTKDSIWTLEYKDRKVYTGERTPAAMFEGPQREAPADGFVLVRHLPGKKPTEFGAREEILVQSLGEGYKITQFAPDAKGNNFLVAVDGNQPKLLAVPIRSSIKASDIISLCLRDPKSASAPQPASASPPATAP